MARRPVETVQLKLRFPEALRRRIERAAEANETSMNSEIVGRLEESFRKDDAAKLGAALMGGDDTATALQLIANAMRLETAAEDGSAWSKSLEKAEAVRTAVHLIVAGVAGLPAAPPPTKFADGVSQLRPSERGRQLARFLLERSNLQLPTDTQESPK
jgi:hypothetical protein